MTMHSEKWGINKLKEERKRLAGELLIADGKLEAVNEWVKDELVMSPVNPSWYTRRIRKLADILEADA